MNKNRNKNRNKNLTITWVFPKAADWTFSKNKNNKAKHTLEKYILLVLKFTFMELKFESRYYYNWRDTRSNLEGIRGGTNLFWICAFCKLKNF